LQPLEDFFLLAGFHGGAHGPDIGIDGLDGDSCHVW
jgi:hypothetical protein